MNDSVAKVTCGPLGSRRFPVRSGDLPHEGQAHHLRGHLRRFGMAYISEGVAAPPGVGCGTPRPHELCNQDGIGLVVTNVVVVGGPGVVLQRDEVAVFIEASAHLECVRRPLGIPGRLFVPHPLHVEPAGRSPWPGTPPQIPHHRRPCDRIPVGPPSRRRAPDPAASRETQRRRFACRRISCHWNRSSSDRSTDRPWHGPDR